MKAEWTNKDSLSIESTGQKAILVIDMPKNCAKCKLMYLQGIGEGICNATDWEERPSWCPLKPMPEKLQFQEPFNDDYTVSWASRLGFVDGWNACIEEIEK